MVSSKFRNKANWLFCVVAVWIVWLQDAQTVLDRQARCADQKATREVFTRRTAHRIDGLPGDEHGHYRRLARAGGKFQRKPHQLGIGVPVRRSEMVENALAVFGEWCDLGEPDRGFHRLHLAEERPDTAELVMAPMLQQAGRLRRDLPLIGIRQGTPGIYMTAHFIDDRRGVVLLFLG